MGEQALILRWTQLPNILMDYVIPLLRESEEKVLLYVLRRTYGWKGVEEGQRKEHDAISFSQFIGGCIGRDGRPHDFGCGVSRPKLAEALAFLQMIDLVQRIDIWAGKEHAGRGATGQYRINLDTGIVQKVNQYLQDPDTARENMVHFLNQCRGMVQELNQKRRESRNSKEPEKNGKESEPLKNGKESEPEMVKKVNLQKKEKETRETTEDTPLPPKKGKGGERGTRLPEDWYPTEADLSWARKKGYHTLVTLDDATDEFRRYWWSRAKDNTKLDWSMTWQNRIQELAKQEQDRRIRFAMPSPQGRTIN